MARKRVSWCLTNPFRCRCGDPKAKLLSDPVLYLSQFYACAPSSESFALSTCLRWNGSKCANGRQCETVASPI
uniref:Uncharacterized protein n=1 Tax=Hyaloperonospora arabidopsidis (strain Emoy2) TaxID=559515 RepID=M4BTK1_HYAAE